MASGTHKSKKGRAPQRLSKLERARALQQQGQLGGAEILYREALAEDDADPEALLGLGVLLTHSGRAPLALELLLRAGAAVHEHAELCVSLAAAHAACGQKHDAKLALQRALALEPLPDAYFKLAELLEELREPGDALACYAEAAALTPESMLFQLRLADALWASGQRARALGHYQAAVNAEPRSLPALIGLAQALQVLGFHAGAIEIAQRALAIDDANPYALLQKGFALLARERTAEAASCFRRAASKQPDSFAAHFGWTSAAFKNGQVAEAVANARRALAIKADPATHSNLIFQLPFAPAVDAAEILAEARRWASAWADPVRGEQLALTPELDPERRLRLAYVSSDFQDHCQAFYMLPLLAAHDRTAVEVVCYSGVTRPDAITEKLKARADGWRDVAQLDDRALAQRIREDRIDILVDLTMHMANGRLRVFARRPAPVQISWLAYPGTTGLSQIDYRITDRHIDPPRTGDAETLDYPRVERDERYSERSLVLPDTFWCYDPLSDEPLSALPALTRGYVTFGCLGNLAKVNPLVIALWSRVLAALPTSRMLLRAPAGEPQARLAQSFRELGIDPARVELVDRQPRARYLQTYQRIDICLDTFPYNGHTTSLDAHWMGVPVVTRVGDTVVGRAGLCQARNLGLDSLIAEDDESFVQSAVALAGDLPKLSALRAALRTRMDRSPLMDAPRFAANLERAYRLAFRAHCAERARAAREA